MKKTYIIIALAAICLSSCQILDLKPQSQISPDDYFKSETELQLFTNPLYDLFSTDFFENQSDHFINMNLSKEIHGGTYRTVPASGGGWSWGTLRRINNVLAYSSNCLNENVVAEYNALARFFRAYFYFEKVKRFGDVPWIDTPLDSDSEQLYAPRDSRELVMTRMLEDIDYAIANLTPAVSTYRVNKWAALALKAQFCLYEGTFRKYHGLNLDGHDYNYYLDLAASSAKEIMDSGKYRLAKDYLTLFAEVNADAGEYILSIKFDKALGLNHNGTAFATMPTQGCPGLTKKFVDSFLMKDGSRFTDKDGWDKMSFMDEVANRDPRLACLTVTLGYKRIGGTDVLAPDYGSSNTGFQLVKFVMDCTLPDVNRVDMSYNDLPVFRLGEIYLIYAEALAELGTLTQDGLDASVNLLRDRVGMPHLDMVKANENPDWYLLSEEYGYRNVTGANQGVILEIRRERAIELAQEGRRWDDLMRWKEGLCINQKMYGPYFPGPGEYDLTGDGVADICLYSGDKPTSSVKTIVFLKIGVLTNGVLLSEGTYGCVDPQQNNQHIFDEARDYFYPIPIEDRTLNPKLTQNPGWNDGLDY